MLDLGRGYEAVGRLDRAEHAYREALAMEPSLSPLHYALGRVLKRLGRDDDAAKALREYRRLYEAEQQRRFDEKSRLAELALARLELRAGNAPAALARFEDLGDTPEALIGRADALSRLGRRDEAIRTLERARVLAPDDARVTYRLARERAAAEGRSIRR
jgi:tetratricopeptide (TPR) repeat protein